MASQLVIRTAATAAVVLALAGCGGGPGGSAEPDGQERAKGIPLPAEVASTGTITEPALAPRWLDESTGTAESADAVEPLRRHGAAGRVEAQGDAAT